MTVAVLLMYPLLTNNNSTDLFCPSVTVYAVATNETLTENNDNFILVSTGIILQSPREVHVVRRVEYHSVCALQ